MMGARPSFSLVSHFNMADEKCRSAVLLICGIPASGKSTFTTKLQRYMQKTKGDSVHTIHVCYDDLIPSDLNVYDSNVAKHLQNDLEEMPDDNSVEKVEGSPFDGPINASKYSLWKQFRKLALEAVEKLMNTIENNLNKDETDKTKKEREEVEIEGLPSFQELWRIFVKSISREERKCSCIASNDWRWNGCPHVILVDDNMFYHSMRYEYVQTARKYSAGFAEVFLECSLEIAETRNNLRSHPVASNTMRNMFSKMEPPEPEKFPWEQYSLTIKAEELDVEIMESVAHLVTEALKHPMLQAVEDIEEKERSRAACITSIVHQADQVLRKYIAKLISEAKGSGKGKKELQFLASQLNKDKKVFLESLHDIKSQTECGSKFKTDLKASKTFESVISRSGCFTERTLKESSKGSSYKTAVQNDKDKVGENDVQGCFVNSMANSMPSGNSRSHLCFQCFPNVEDKEGFKSFVEELFMGTGQSYAQVNKVN